MKYLFLIIFIIIFINNYYCYILFILQSLNNENASTTKSIQDKAMQYFHVEGLCSHFMVDRDQRNKIFSYLANEEAAAHFVRIPDVFKNDFVHDFIINK